MRKVAAAAPGASAIVLFALVWMVSFSLGSLSMSAHRATADILNATGSSLMIFDIAVGDTTESTVRIRWRTNYPADSQVSYFPATATGGTASSATACGGENSGLVVDHCVKLAGLAPGTTYYYRAISRDAYQRIAYSDHLSFATASGSTSGGTQQPAPFAPPVISDVRVELLDAARARVRWRTDRPADSSVSYGASGQTSMISTARCDAGGMVTDHCVELRELLAATMYQYRAVSGDGTAAGHTYSDMAAFMTPGALNATASGGSGSASGDASVATTTLVTAQQVTETSVVATATSAPAPPAAANAELLPLAAPQNARGSFVNGVVRLAWDPPPSGEPSGYRIFRSGRERGVVKHVTLVFEDAFDLAPGATYTYAIQAIRSDGAVSPMSNIIVTIPARPATVVPPAPSEPVREESRTQPTSPSFPSALPEPLAAQSGSARDYFFGIADAELERALPALQAVAVPVVLTPRDARSYCSSAENVARCEGAAVAAGVQQKDIASRASAIAESGRAVRETFRARRADPEAARDENENGIADFDEAYVYGTSSLTASAPGGDARSVRDKLLHGIDPATDEPVRAESPRLAGVTDAEALPRMNVRFASPISDRTDAARRIELSGTAPPLSIVTVYVFSEPIVVRVQADGDGVWRYTFDRELPDGDHEVWSAITDTSGRVLVKSEPLPFVQTAFALTVGETAAAAQVETPTAQGFVTGGGLPVLVAALVLVLILAFAGIGLAARRGGAQTGNLPDALLGGGGENVPGDSMTEPEDRAASDETPGKPPAPNSP